jgi:hypothetical protein
MRKCLFFIFLKSLFYLNYIKNFLQLISSYVVFNYMDTTLRDVIKTQKLSNGQIKFLAYQILR